MKVNRSGETLNLSEIRELSALTSCAIRSQVQDSLAWPVREVSVDLRDTKYMDCRGLGALLSIRKEASKLNPGVTFHLRNPSTEIARLVRLTGLECTVADETVGGARAALPTATSSLMPLSEVSSTATGAVPILLNASIPFEVVTKTE